MSTLYKMWCRPTACISPPLAACRGIFDPNGGSRLTEWFTVLSNGLRCEHWLGYYAGSNIVGEDDKARLNRMHLTYIAPTEMPPSSLEIKRALLTYDKVVLSDPGDRDFFPPQLLFQAISSGMGIPFLFGIDTGPVRPLGKVPNYDNDFDKLLEEINFARREGLIDVVSTYERETENRLTIGAVPTGGYPLDPTFMLYAYRNLARDNAALSCAISGDPLIASGSPELLSAIGGELARADLSVNDDPSLPMIDADLARPDLREVFSKISRARLASVIKSIGYCTEKQFVPSFRDPCYVNALGHIMARAVQAMDVVAEGDPYLILRSKVLDIVHSEYIDDDVLAQLSIDEVLRLRTKAWGTQAEARDRLLQSAAELAQECKTADFFEEEVRKRIAEYSASWDELLEERRQLNFMIKCDIIGTGAKAAGFGLVGGIAGTYAQLQSGIGAATLLLAGCLFAMDRLKEYKPMHERIVKAEEQFRDHVCFGLHDFHRRLA